MAARTRKRSEPAKGTKSGRGQGANGQRTAAAVVPAPAAPYEPTPRERAAIQRMAARRRRTTPTPRMKIEATPDMRGLLPDHADPACAAALLADTFGTADGQFVEGLLLQLSNVPRASAAERELNFMLSIVRGIGPKDETEALLATQMAAIHHATMVAAHRLQRVDNIPQQDSASNMLNKLARTFVGQVEALKNYRSSGEQHIRVQHQHVTVNDGGQAIVAGHIKQGGEGSVAKTEHQPHAPSTAHERGPALLGYVQALGMPLLSKIAGFSSLPLPQNT